MITARKYLLSLMLIIAQFTFAFEQHVRGSVTSLSGATGVANCKVRLSGQQRYEALTDSTGHYDLLVEPGKYQVSFYKEGYALLNAGEVQVLSARQYVIDVQLRESNLQLDTVVVTAEENANEIKIEMWESQRQPASFYDPARAVTAHAGVINTDDQANNVSVYGASPNFVQWRLEGVEIVNPNHLENSGTFNDRPTLNGGGVSLLSAQVVQGSSFNYAPFAAPQGNALAGIFDMKFRNGNNQRSERIAQIGLLGTDICFEGPFSKKHAASYLINYRYSTVGLLSQLGVDFGEERINYQDLSFATTFPTKKGVLRLFGTGGLSTNDYTGTRDTALLEMQKQLQDIRYRSATGIGGASYVHSLTNTSYIKVVAAYSAKQVGRISEPVLSWPGIVPGDEFYLQQKISTVAFYSYRFSGFVLKGGSYFNYFVNALEIKQPGVLSRSLSEHLVQPFVSLEHFSFGKFDLAAGAHLFAQPRLSFYDVQPRLELKWRMTETQQLSLYAGRSAQLQNPLLALQAINGLALTPDIVNSAALIYRLQVRRTALTPRIFYNSYTNLAANDSFFFSSINYLNEQLSFSLNSEGKAQSYGLEVNTVTNVDGWYLQGSGTVFNSEFASARNVYRESRFNARYNLVLNAGRERRLRDERRTLGVYLKYIWRDGFLEAADESPYLYSNRLPAYYRVDARISLQTDKRRVTSLLALDIQNLTNRKNVAYHYTDLFTGSRETRYQLGIVPVLSYKLFF